MAKNIVICAALLVLSLANLKAMNEPVRIVEIPLRIQIDSRNPNNPKVSILDAENEFVPGRKVLSAQHVAFMFDPENPNEPVAIVDVKKAIIKLVAKNPELAKRAGITTSDFANAGISLEELASMREEPQSEAENAAIESIMRDLSHGDTSVGINYLLASGVDVITGGGKAAVGSFILIRKSLEALYKFVASSLNQAPVRSGKD